MRVRRVGNLYYTRCFANELYRELVYNQGRLNETLRKLQMWAAEHGNERFPRDKTCENTASSYTASVPCTVPRAALVALSSSELV